MGVAIFTAALAILAITTTPRKKDRGEGKK